LKTNLQTYEGSKVNESVDNEEIIKAQVQRRKDISQSIGKYIEEMLEATNENEEEPTLNTAEMEYDQPSQDKTQTNQCKDPKATINKPMTAWLKKNLPKLAEEGQNMFQSIKLPMIMSKQEYQQMIANEQQGQSMTADIQQNQQTEEGTKQNKSVEETREELFLRASKIEGKINKPMTAWLQNLFDSIKTPKQNSKKEYQAMTAEKQQTQPISAEKQQIQPISAEKQQKHRAMSYLLKQDRQGPVKIQPKQPFAGVMQQARQEHIKIQPKQPMTALRQQNQPITAVMQQSQPMTAVMQQYQPITTVMQQGQPMTSVMQQYQPMTSVMQQYQPMTAVMHQYQPMTAVMQPSQSITAVMHQNQPMTASMQQAQTMPAVMHQKQPMVAVMGSFIPAVSQPIQVQSGQTLYRSIQQLPVVGQLSRPIAPANTAASSVPRQQLTTLGGQHQQYAFIQARPNLTNQ
jgi:hypothetical protein